MASTPQAIASTHRCPSNAARQLASHSLIACHTVIPIEHVREPEDLRGPLCRRRKLIAAKTETPVVEITVMAPARPHPQTRMPDQPRIAGDLALEPLLGDQVRPIHRAVTRLRGVGGEEAVQPLH